MTLSEVVLGAAVGLVILAAAAAWYDSELNRAKVRQVSALIEGLGEAVRLYAETVGRYPPGRPNGSCDAALAAMQKVPESARRLQGLGSSLIFMSDGKLRCLDPWGRPLRYLTSQSERPDHRRRVDTTGRVPFFESSGPDRDFGDTDPIRQTDNICGDDASVRH